MTDLRDAPELCRVLALIERCVACGGKGHHVNNAKAECQKCRGVGWTVVDKGQFQALMQRLKAHA